MRTDDPNYPFKRNPLRFEDVAAACAVRWCVSRESAIKYLTARFDDPGQAYADLKQALRDQRAPDEFWVTL
jgi:hypothetical protein